MKKFAYFSENAQYTLDEAHLDVLGDEGWELIGPPVWDGLYKYWVYYFKREIK